MKTKSAKQPKRSKTTAKLKDIKPRKNAKGGAATQGRSLFVLSTDKLGPHVVN